MRSRLLTAVVAAHCALVPLFALACTGCEQDAAAGKTKTAVPVATPGGSRVTIPVEGVDCAACILGIRSALKKLEGVKAVEGGKDDSKTVVVTFEPGKVKPAQMVEAINGLGYKAGTPKEGN